MKKYKHLTSIEREKLSVLHAKNLSISEIARILKRSKSTICRELHRDSSVFYRGTSLGESSSRNYICCWAVAHKKDRLKSIEIRNYTIAKLKQYWTPERIAGRLKAVYNVNISHEAIYQFIYDGKRYLTKYLTRKHMARKRNWQVRKGKILTG